MRQSAVIYFYEGYITVSPTIQGLAQALQKDNFSVRILGTRNKHSCVDSIGNGIEVIYFDHLSDRPFFKKLFRVFYRLKLDTLISLFEVVYYALNCYCNLRKDRTFKGAVGFGTDTFGSVAAYMCTMLQTTRYYLYLSLELKLFDEFRLFEKAVFYLEKISYRNAAALIIQDRDRYDSLSLSLGCSGKTVFFLPNAASSLSTGSFDGTNFFRKTFDLKNYHYLVVHAGMICDEVFSMELARSFSKISKDYVLIYHDREKRDYSDPYIASLLHINSKNLFLSLDPVVFEEIDSVFASATIGTAIYRPINNNFSQIAMASGKISYYLKHGKPVIVNNIPSLKKLVDDYRIGVVIDDIENSEEVEKAIDTIIENYDTYSSNARTCFLKEFDFAAKIKPLVSYVKSRCLSDIAPV
jgi:hypothetical protein